MLYLRAVLLRLFGSIFRDLGSSSGAFPRVALIHHSIALGRYLKVLLSTSWIGSPGVSSASWWAYVSNKIASEHLSGSSKYLWNVLSIFLLSLRSSIL